MLFLLYHPKKDDVFRTLTFLSHRLNTLNTQTTYLVQTTYLSVSRIQHSTLPDWFLSTILDFILNITPTILISAVLKHDNEKIIQIIQTLDAVVW